MFLTGSLLVVGSELESMGRPAVWTTAAIEERTASFGTIYNGVKSSYPEATIFLIEKRPSPWFVDQASGHTGWGERARFWTDPRTGQVVDVTGGTGFREVIRGLHDNFLSGQNIVYIAICATSVVLLYQIISGLITYRRFWKGLFRWPRLSAGFRSWSGAAHRLAAIWATPLLLITALTGFFFLLVALGFEGGRPNPQPPIERDSRLPANFSAATLDQAEERARAALKGFEPTTLKLPARKADSFRFFGHVSGIAEIRGLSAVTLDPETLDVLGVSTPNDNTGMARWSHIIEVLHYGFWGGAFSRAIWVVLGLVATGTALTGALIFAARLAPEALHYGPLRRIWRGLGLFRWAYLLILLGILAAGYVRYGPDSYRTTRVYATDTAGSGAHLLLHAPLRRDRPMEVELRLEEPTLRAASIEINGDSVPAKNLHHDGEKARIQVTFNPGGTANDLTARLEKTDGSERTYIFHLGRPVW